jgi:hypothetical protein
MRIARESGGSARLGFPSTNGSGNYNRPPALSSESTGLRFTAEMLSASRAVKDSGFGEGRAEFAYPLVDNAFSANIFECGSIVFEIR